MTHIIMMLFLGAIIASPFILFYKWAVQQMKKEIEAEIKAGKKYRPTIMDVACGRSGYH